jgi:hypothetical protein
MKQPKLLVSLALVHIHLIERYWTISLMLAVYRVQHDEHSESNNCMNSSTNCTIQSITVNDTTKLHLASNT